jgi:hypothetical protein
MFRPDWVIHRWYSAVRSFLLHCLLWIVHISIAFAASLYGRSGSLIYRVPCIDLHLFTMRTSTVEKLQKKNMCPNAVSHSNTCKNWEVYSFLITECASLMYFEHWNDILLSFFANFIS